VSLAGTLLDSYADRREDELDGEHSYISHYPTRQAATKRIVAIVQRSLREIKNLPDGSRHAVIVRCMVGMYLSKDSARETATRADTDKIAQAAESSGYVRILRLWRIFYKQKTT
jgi:calcineurin-like phosphoesterase family protein